MIGILLTCLLGAAPTPTPEPSWWRDEGTRNHLALTDSQVRELEASRERAAAELDAAGLATNAARENLDSLLLSAESIDATRLRASVDAYVAAKRKQDSARTALLLSLRGVLTGEQWMRLGRERHESGRGPAPTPSSAHLPASDVPRGLWWRDEASKARLEITPEEERILEAVFQKHRLALDQVRQRHETEERALFPLVRANDPALREQLERTAAAREELDRVLVTLRAEMRAALPLAKRQRLGTATSSKTSRGR
ncbi:MAG: Spy/CpxP family protein refolding chaperone [Acidobacteria bacterium]|nr:Spy/CpxP family protein refolding chaperone [Acidobacteriota bacterium]